MKGRLFVHLGPPKTGSTSLQYALMTLNVPRYTYLGVNQPRGDNPGGLVHTLHEACAARMQLDAIPVQTAVAEIASEVERGQCVMISEEMFLYWEAECTIWDKLERLEKALCDIPRTYILTLRDPLTALPSYYQELEPRLPAKQRLRPGDFFRHEACDCYDYAALAVWFVKAGQAVRWVEIEQLGAKRLALSEVLGPQCPISAKLEIDTANVGRKSGAKGARSLAQVALSDVVGNGAARGVSNRLKETAPVLHGTLKRVARSITLQPQRDIVLKIPEDVRQRFEQSYAAVKDALRTQPEPQ